MIGKPDSHPRFWRIWLIAEGVLLDPLEDALTPLGVAVSRFEEQPAEAGDPPPWRLEVLCDEEPSIAGIALLLASVAGKTGQSCPDFHVEPLGDVDWLALNRAQFPPVRAGRFLVCGSHVDPERIEGQDRGPDRGLTVLRVDAGPAFGSGTHETTRGCLHAIGDLLEEWRFRRALDLGCGSGILGLALALGSGVQVVCADSDPVSVATAKENAERNGVDHLVEVRLADGPDPGLAAEGGFDLVVANILAEPLIAFAPRMEGILAGQALVILSGLLASQEEAVLEAYRGVGFRLRRTIALGDWSTLILDH